MVFEQISEFSKDLKKLKKKYSSLDDDLDTVKQVLEIRPDASPPMSFRINDLGITTCVIKVKKIACKSLKGRGRNSGLRLIYAYFEKEKRIVFVELYHKNDRKNHDKDRILRYFK